MNEKELLKHATDFAFYPEGAEKDEVNGRYYRVTVSKRSEDKWAVIFFNECWHQKEQDWVYESLPSNRTEEFTENTRFSLETAVSIAVEMTEKLVVNGRTYAQWLEFRAGKKSD